ncbi:MAG: 4Fe-4S binding protein [Kiritimatiellae bacterium]|jgi:NosR/NirI family nitrous oxide reductase transcriptional regulator|nr:4Fe-4S binding protein [Kiritimatiellia bacterium]
MIPSSIINFALFRFPKPDFSNNYEIPPTPLPSPDFLYFPEIYNPIMLCIILALTVWIFYKLRNRKILLALIFLVILIFGFIKNGCLCPIGAIQTVSLAVASKTFPITINQIFLFLIPVIAAMFFGRIFCGAACPIGGVQDVLNYKNFRIPKPIHEFLTLIPFFYLGFAILYAALDIDFIICAQDPYVGIFRGAFTKGTIIATFIILLIGLVNARPYCKYLCPYGAILKVFSVLSRKPADIPIDKDCINCDFCKDVCPTNAIIPPSTNEKRNISMNRIKVCLAISPGIIAIGLAFGLYIGKFLLINHPDVIKYNSAQIDDPELDTVINNALQTGNIVQTASLILGLYLALVVIIKLIYLCKVRRNTTYVIDKINCVCCARCYKLCPKSQK